MRTTDEELIRSILTHPRVWARVAEDGIEPHEYRPLRHPRVFYLVRDEKLCSFKPVNGVTWEHHIAATPGEGGIEQFALDCVEWMFENTPAEKLVAMPPSFNWHAAALARRIGYRDEGRITRCVKWRGRLHDMLVLGIEKWKQYR